MQVCTIEFGQVASMACGLAFKPITAEDEDILDATVGQICARGCPQGGAFIISNPQAQDALDTVDVDADRHVARLVDYTVAIADLHA